MIESVSIYRSVQTDALIAGVELVVFTSVMTCRNVRIRKAIVSKQIWKRFEHQIDIFLDDFIKAPHALLPTAWVIWTIFFGHCSQSLSSLVVIQQFSAYVDSYQKVSGFLLFVREDTI